MMAFNGFGFGYYNFGHFPFGKADYGEDSIVRSFPATYIENPSTGEINQSLKNYLYIAKDIFNKKKIEIDKLDEQMDVNKIRTDILRYLGSTIAVDLDDYEPDDFRKSLVSNAVMFYRIKGTSESYKIRGKISGYEVDVINIWRIDQSRRIKETTNFTLTQGDGNTFQEISGNIVTWPLLKNTLKIKVNDVIVAEDDGAGIITNVIGSTYTINGTISYGTGAYVIQFTPAPPLGINISADFSTGVEDRLLGTSAGGSSLTINSAQNNPYPMYPTSLKIYDEGTLIAQDDGNGNIIGTGVIGTVDYSVNNINLTITPAPTVGHNITANFDKTLLADFLFCHPDDIYEIPAKSGIWYVTIHPSKAAGNLSEGCGYCLTSYIKLKLTVLKPITISTGTENFFDRLVRKLRDITPIHIRDLLYELQMVVTIDESQYLTFGGLRQEELSWIVHSNFHRFDIVPADVISTDTTAYVSGTVELIEE
jgi:hypothetical protein